MNEEIKNKMLNNLKTSIISASSMYLYALKNFILNECDNIIDRNNDNKNKVNLITNKLVDYITSNNLDLMTINMYYDIKNNFYKTFNEVRNKARKDFDNLTNKFDKINVELMITLITIRMVMEDDLMTKETVLTEFKSYLKETHIIDKALKEAMKEPEEGSPDYFIKKINEALNEAYKNHEFSDIDSCKIYVKRVLDENDFENHVKNNVDKTINHKFYNVKKEYENHLLNWCEVFLLIIEKMIGHFTDNYTNFFIDLLSKDKSIIKGIF